MLKTKLISGTKENFGKAVNEFINKNGENIINLYFSTAIAYKVDIIYSVLITYIDNSEV